METEAWDGDHEVSSAQGFSFLPFLFCIPSLPTLQELYYVQFDCYERPPQTSAHPNGLSGTLTHQQHLALRIVASAPL